MYSKATASRAHVYRERSEFERLINSIGDKVGIHSATHALLETMAIKCLNHMINGSDLSEQRFAKRVSQEMSKMPSLKDFIDRIYDCPNSLSAFLEMYPDYGDNDETSFYERRANCRQYPRGFNDYGETFQSLLSPNGDSPKRIDFLKHIFVEYVRRFDIIITKLNDYENDPETGDDEWQSGFICYRNFYYNFSRLNISSQTVAPLKVKNNDASRVDKTGMKGSSGLFAQSSESRSGSWADVLKKSSKASDEKTNSSIENSSESSDDSCEVNKLSRSTLLEHSVSQPIETLPKYTKVKRLELGENGKFNEFSEIMDSKTEADLIGKSAGANELEIFKIGSFCPDTNQISIDQVLALPSVIATLKKVTVLPDGSDILFKPSDYDQMKTHAENTTLVFGRKKLTFAVMRYGKTVDEISECLMEI